MNKKAQLEEQIEPITSKQKFNKFWTGSYNPTPRRWVVSIILLLICWAAVITMIGMIVGWGNFLRPAAMSSIKNAISVKSFTATVVSSKGSELYSIKYKNGIYYSVSNNMLEVWSYNDDETVKYLKAPLNGRSEQAVLNELKNIEPYVGTAEYLGETNYLLHRAISVDTTTIKWMGDYPTVFHLISHVNLSSNDNILNIYGAEIKLPNSNMTCVVAYKLKALKLTKIEIGYSNGLSLVTKNYNISKINKTNFDFKFKN